MDGTQQKLDLLLDRGINLQNHDCNKFMACLADERVHLTVTSPPYDNLRTYNGSLQWDDLVWQNVIRELYRITVDGGFVVWVIGDATIKGSETGTSFKQALYFKDCGFNLHDTMIWNKPSVPPTQHNRYQPNFEFMFVFCKGKPRAFNPIKEPTKTCGRVRNSHRSVDNNHSLNDEGTYTTKEFKNVGNVWTIPVSNNKNIHPAVFPLRLAEDHIKSWSNEGDTVFDPFMGSGTTALASRVLNRNFIGSEINYNYFISAVDRCYKEEGFRGGSNEYCINEEV